MKLDITKIRNNIMIIKSVFILINYSNFIKYEKVLKILANHESYKKTTINYWRGRIRKLQD